MKFVALVSGGKDSIYSIVECHRQGHELIACVHMGRPIQSRRQDGHDDKEEEESYMYQTAASETLTTLVKDCLGVPLIMYTRQGKSLNTSLVYEEAEDNQDDEVEDLYQALWLAKQQFPDVQAVSSGAILSTYQRVRIENVCSRLGLTSLSYLWRRATQHELLQNMLDDGIVAVLVRTAAPPGLVPRKHLNRTLNELQNHFHRLHQLYQFHVCGEGGEFETLCLDSPVHRKKLVLDQVEIIEFDDDGTGELLIRSCHAESKTEQDVAQMISSCSSADAVPSVPTSTSTGYCSNPTASTPITTRLRVLPHVHLLSGGLLHVSEMMSSQVPQSPQDGFQSEAELAIVEALDIFESLKRGLQQHGCTTQDVMMVHLYLSEISHFSLINEHYRNLFGVTLPPSRSCVAVGRGRLPDGRRVLLDCIAQRASGAYMRTSSSSTTAKTDPAVQAALATSTSKLRQVLHVQSRSHWAPVCVGPYSQANTLWGVLHFIAGQVGLEPASMTLRPTWEEQLIQSWRNVAQVLDSLDGGSMDNLTSGLVYVADSIGLTDGNIEKINSICREQIETNSGIVPGAIEGLQRQPADLDGYEDEETMRELTQSQLPEQKDVVPLFAVSIPALPIGALVEVEVVSVTSSFAPSTTQKMSSNEASIHPIRSPPSLSWDTGHSFPVETTCLQIQLDSAFRSMGNNSIASGVVIASLLDGVDYCELDPTIVVGAMMSSLGRSVLFDTSSLMNLRVYYIPTVVDGTIIRSAFHRAVSDSLTGTTVPATTFVPVSDLCFLTAELRRRRPLVAFQAFSLNAIQAETWKWVHYGR